MRTIVFILIATFGLHACSNDALPALVAEDVVVYAPIPGQSMSAAYLSFKNNTANDIKISKVRSREFGTVEFHKSVLENGTAKMRRIEELTVPANATVKLENGGKHLMLMHPNASIESVMLSFYDSRDTLLLEISTTTTSRLK